MPNHDIDDADLQRDPEPDDFSPAAIVRKLDRATKVTTRVNGRLSTINDRFGAPPDPMKPQLRASLEALRLQNVETARLIDVLETQVRVT